MDKLIAQQRIQTLSKELHEHNHKYYVLSAPSISDFQFDSMLERASRHWRWSFQN